MIDDETRKAAARAAVKDWVADTQREPARRRRSSRSRKQRTFVLESRMHKWWGVNPKWQAWHVCGRYHSEAARRQALEKFLHEKQTQGRTWIEYRIPEDQP